MNTLSRVVADLHCHTIASTHASVSYTHLCIISLDEFPLSDDFKIILKAMCEEYQTYLNWEYPPDPSPWTEEHKADFRKRAKEGYDRFVKEVGPDFIVENRVDVL